MERVVLPPPSPLSPRTFDSLARLLTMLVVLVVAFPVIELKQGEVEFPLLGRKGVQNPKYGQPKIKLQIAFHQATKDRQDLARAQDKKARRGRCCGGPPA